MLCALWPLIPVGKSWWAIASCKLNLGIYLSSAPCLNVTVELNNYWDEPPRELVGFQALDVFIKMRLEAFLQVSICAMYKLFRSLQGEMNKSWWSALWGEWAVRHQCILSFPVQEGPLEGWVFLLECSKHSSALVTGNTKRGRMTSSEKVGLSWSLHLLPAPLWCKPSPGSTSANVAPPLATGPVVSTVLHVFKGPPKTQVWFWQVRGMANRHR